MFSGGLDSVIAVHLMKEQGLDVTALHFVLPFESGFDYSHDDVKEKARVLNVPLRIEEEGGEFLEMISDPSFGFGKNINPCIDCRIHRLNKAVVIMNEIGASFLVTGEVVGQRPKSQRLHSMNLIEKRAGLSGRLLRPLTALLLEPTIPEQEGIVDRTRLLAIHGRSRKEQLAYAKKYSLKHGSPGGGCVLTEKEIAGRYNDLMKYNHSLDLNDFKLLAYGRHFRLTPEFRMIIGRYESENDVLEKLIEKNSIRFIMTDITGPVGIGKGNCTTEEKMKAASILARYSRDRDKKSCSVKIIQNGKEEVVVVNPIDDGFCVALRV